MNFLIYSFSTVLCIWPQLNAFSAISALETSQKVQVLQQQIQVSLPYFLLKFSFKLKPIIIFIFEVSIIYQSTQIYWPQKIPFLSNMDILRADIFVDSFSYKIHNSILSRIMSNSILQNNLQNPQLFHGLKLF